MRFRRRKKQNGQPLQSATRVHPALRGSDSDSNLCVRIEDLNHTYGAGELRKQVLYDNDLELARGEIVIMTGPSGSGKTTLLTLVGALRTVQEGSVQVMGNELAGLDDLRWPKCAATSASSFRRTTCSSRSPPNRTSAWPWS